MFYFDFRIKQILYARWKTEGWESSPRELLLRTLHGVKMTWHQSDNLFVVLPDDLNMIYPHYFEPRLHDRPNHVHGDHHLFDVDVRLLLYLLLSAVVVYFHSFEEVTAHQTTPVPHQRMTLRLQKLE